MHLEPVATRVVNPTSVVLPASQSYAQQACRHVGDGRSAPLVCNAPSAQAGADGWIVALYNGAQPDLAMPSGDYMGMPQYRLATCMSRA
jgi:hypothetical protein